MLPESSCGHKLRKCSTQSRAFPGLQSPSSRSASGCISVCGFSYCAKSTVPGRRSLRLKQDSPESPSLPHLIQSICSSPSHPSRIQMFHTCYSGPGRLNPLTSPGRKAKQKWWSSENSFYLPFSISLFPSPPLSTALLREDPISFLFFSDKPSCSFHLSFWMGSFLRFTQLSPLCWIHTHLLRLFFSGHTACSQRSTHFCFIMWGTIVKLSLFPLSSPWTLSISVLYPQCSF